MAKINEITITELTFQEGAAPSTPASTKWKPYFKTDGLYVMDDAGTETGPLGTGGGGGTFSGVGVNRITSSQSISSGVDTALEWNDEDFDTDNYHDNSTNPSRFTVPATGEYLVQLTPYFSGDPGVLFAYIFIDGSLAKWLCRWQPTDDSGDIAIPLHGVVQVSSGSYIEIFVSLSSAADLFQGRSSCAVIRLDS